MKGAMKQVRPRAPNGSPRVLLIESTRRICATQ